MPLEPPQSTPSSDRERRTQFTLLQALIGLVLSYQLLFSDSAPLPVILQASLILTLLGSVAAILLLPLAVWTTTWFIGGVILVDTAITSTIMYLSSSAGSDLYLTFFLIMLVAAFAPTFKQMIALSCTFSAAYGVALVLDTLRVQNVTETHLLRIPVLLVMAIFYGFAAELARTEHARRLRAEELLNTGGERRRAARRRTDQAWQPTEEKLHQTQKMEAVGRLAGGVAHDFNTLMTALQGYGRFMLKSLGQDDPLQKCAEEITKTASRAAALAQQLLAFGRKHVSQFKVVNLNSLLEELDPMVRRLVGANIELITARDPLLGPIRAEFRQLEELIINLVLNARDAMPDGGKLTITTSNVRMPASSAQDQTDVPLGPYVLLQVSDTGCGMDVETQSRIFEPLFTTRGQSKATGLGLSLVAEVVRENGGHIDVVSEPSRGTTFKIYLPRCEETVAPTRLDMDAEATPGGTETILLVEDDACVRELLSEFLQESGYHVLQAAYAGEALQVGLHYGDQIHLLLTDVIMPGMRGQELAEQLKSTRQDLKVLYVSAYAKETVLDGEASKNGLAFLQKPFSPDALAHKVHEVLHASHPVAG